MNDALRVPRCTVSCCARDTRKMLSTPNATRNKKLNSGTW